MPNATPKTVPMAKHKPLASIGQTPGLYSHRIKDVAMYGTIIQRINARRYVIYVFMLMCYFSQEEKWFFKAPEMQLMHVSSFSKTPQNDSGKEYLTQEVE